MESLLANKATSQPGPENLAKVAVECGLTTGLSEQRLHALGRILHVAAGAVWWFR